jgi:hypothetical protein
MPSWRTGVEQMFVTKLNIKKTYDTMPVLKASAIEVVSIKVNIPGGPSSTDIDLRVDKKQYVVVDGRARVNSPVIGDFGIRVEGDDEGPEFSESQRLQIIELLGLGIEEDAARSSHLRRLCEDVSNAVANDDWAGIEEAVKRASMLCPHPWYYKNIMSGSYSRTAWFAKSLELFEDDPEVGRRGRRPGPNMNGSTLVRELRDSNTNLFKVIALLANRANPNERLPADEFPNEFQRAPLHLAAEQSPPIIVELLLEYGADPNAKTSTGHTPLTLAGTVAHRHRRDGRREEYALVCKNIGLLLQHGARISDIDPNDWRFTDSLRIIQSLT